MITTSTIKSFFTGIEVDFNRMALRSCTVFIGDPVVGNYALFDDDADRLRNDPDSKNKITCVLAERKLRIGQTDTIVAFKVFDSPKEFDGWSIKTVDELLNLYPKSVLEMLERSLVNLSHLIKHPSDTVKIGSNHTWLLYSPTVEGAYYILSMLSSSEYLTRESHRVGDEKWMSCRFMPKGWEKLSTLQRPDAGARSQAFVAMWFDPDMQLFYTDGFMPAIEKDGTMCVRIDRKEHNNKICDEIIAEIRKSRYVVADFTGQRGGVYYEAGFAHGLGIPVIWTVREDQLLDIHFDTRQYNHISYANPLDLREKLEARINATIPKALRH